VLKAEPVPPGTDETPVGTIALADIEPDLYEEPGAEREEDPETTTFPEVAPVDEPSPADPVEDVHAPPQEDLTLEPLPDPGGREIPLGLDPSVTVVGRTTGSPPLMRLARLQRRFTKGEKDEATLEAARFVRASLGLGRGSRGDPLAVLDKNDILVVTGSFDNIGRVLGALRLPFTPITPLSMTFKDSPSIEGYKVIFYNCGESPPRERLSTIARRLRKFVEKGGYLFTTDWSVGTILMAAFPGYLTTSGPMAPLPETLIRIGPASGKETHSLLKGVFHRGVQGLWWLEQASYDVKIVDTRNVEPLIVSDDLTDLHGRSPDVAVTFRYGKGRVLHVMGHYYQEEGNLAGTISTQRLALNFVVERLLQDTSPRR
jgi:hypothetical protein